VDLHEGCRAIVKLRAGLPDEDEWDPDVLAFVAVDSELDDVPLGSVRELWEPTALAEKDRKRDRYLGETREGLLSACRGLIERWGTAKGA
jgi:hypothetical protein